MSSSVIIYKGELDYISRCILDYPDIETGGNLFGYRTPQGVPVVLYALGPGEKARHHPTMFMQDVDFFGRNADFLIKEHALSHIGSWHSHHRLNLCEPSGGDTASVLEGMRESNVESFLLVIGNCYSGVTTANAYGFSLSSHNYRECRWSLLDGDSPLRIQFDRAHPHLAYQPRTKSAGERFGKNYFETIHLLKNTDIMTEERLKMEYKVLASMMSEKQFRFTGFNTHNPCLMVAQRTNSGKIYTVKIDLSGNFPYEVPKVFITNPKPLLTRTGEPMLGPSHPMHTLQSENGCVRICHYGAQDWTPRVTLSQIILKVRVWLEVYEAYLLTGEPLDRVLLSADY
ncbi:MAG: hypothetical protein LBC19_05225 [Tannerella sp.]|jgi:ubiquitin-protein ligase|nr:hypothetical protein [Tannerella sp.]